MSWSLGVQPRTPNHALQRTWQSGAELGRSAEPYPG
jgi:hypothetical protein